RKTNMVLDMEARLFWFLSLPSNLKPVGTPRNRHLGTIAFLHETESIVVELPRHIFVLNQQPDMIDMIRDATGRHELALAGGHLAAGHVLNDLDREAGRLKEIKTQIAFFVLCHSGRYRHTHGSQVIPHSFGVIRLKAGIVDIAVVLNRL